jgi:hypothetical protein
MTVLILSPVWAAARNVDVSTIPPRDTVQLTIYNGEDLTLVRETRTVTFKQGINPLQFSWANTLIDPTSVDLRFKTHADQLELLDTTSTSPAGSPGRPTTSASATRLRRPCRSRGSSG